MKSIIESPRRALENEIYSKWKDLKTEFLCLLWTIFISREIQENVWEIAAHPPTCLAHNPDFPYRITNTTHFSTPSTFANYLYHSRWYVIHASTPPAPPTSQMLACIARHFSNSLGRWFHLLLTILIRWKRRISDLRNFDLHHWLPRELVTRIGLINITCHVLSCHLL